MLYKLEKLKSSGETTFIELKLNEFFIYNDFIFIKVSSNGYRAIQLFKIIDNLLSISTHNLGYREFNETTVVKKCKLIEAKISVED